MESLNEQFGTAAEFEEPKGGIFLWVKLPDNVDTQKFYQPALKAGVAINPGPEWSVNKPHARSRMRLCFASPTHDEIRNGIAALAEVCHKEFGVPARISNVERAGGADRKPDRNVHTQKCYQPALKAGVAINPGPEWSVNKPHARSRMRLCFASPTHDEIRNGIAALAEVCHKEFGVPARISNVERAGGADRK